MNDRELLSLLVRIFKALPNPRVLEGGTKIKVEGALLITQDLFDLLKELVEKLPSINEYIVLEVDGIQHDFLDCSSNHYAEKNVSNLTVGFPRRNKIPEVYIFNNEFELIQSHKKLLSCGNPLPNSFYLASSDYISDESESNTKLQKIERVLDWFSIFEEISNLNRKGDSCRELIFIEKAGQEKLTKPIHFETNILAEMIDIEDIPDVGHFFDLKDEKNDSSLHHEEKRKFLRIAFVETLARVRAQKTGNDDSLEIVKSLDLIRNSYYEHLELFMEDFVVSEFKKDIEEAHFSYLEKIESVIGNIQGKLYAIPASFLALGALARSNNTESNLLILVAAGLASLFTFLMIISQKGRAEYLSSSISFIFEKFERNSEEEKSNIGILSNVCDIKESLCQQLEKKKKLILFYSIVSWLPFLASLIVIYIRFNEKINSWLKSILQYLLI